MDGEALEEYCMLIIVSAGEAKTKAIEALRLAKVGQFEKAREVYEKSKEALQAAHRTHFDLLQKEVSGEIQIQQNTLSVHAQCHLVTAENTLEYSQEFMELYEKLFGEV